MQDAPFRPLDDIGIPVPAAMDLPVDAELQALVARLAGITRGSGIVLAAREVAADPTPTGKLRTVLALLKLLVFGRAQQTLDEVVASAPRLGCKSGCSHCCYRSIEVTIAEAILVAAHLSDPADPRVTLMAETAAAFRGLDEAARRRTGRPCPLLVDGLCSVYDDRPLACRGMMATDAEACRASRASLAAGGPPLAIEQFVNAEYFLLGDQAGMRGVLKDMGLQHELVDLTSAVAAILADPGLIGRWLEGETIFGPAEIIVPVATAATTGGGHG